MSDIPLSYESRRPAALEPGERVIWEQRPVPTRLRADPMNRRIYRITDRRAISLLDDEKPTVSAVILDQISSLTTTTRPGRNGTASAHGGHGSVAFERLRDASEPALMMLQAVARSHRAVRRRRRVGRVQYSSPMNTIIEPSATTTAPRPMQLPPEFALLDGERVLWAGQPRPRDPMDAEQLRRRVIFFAWTMVPVSALLNRFTPILPAYQDAIPWVLVAVAALWLIMAIWSVTISPILEYLRRRRTYYVLTNLRTVAIERKLSGRTTCRSWFIDLAATASLAVRGDGWGDVGAAYGMEFKSIPDARALHALLLEAIHRAGSPREAAEPEPEPEDEI